ncbi:S8 family serine peptidase [Chloroflexota bacterium]
MNRKLLLMTAVILALVVSLIGPATVAASPPEMVKVLIGFDRQPGSDEVAIVRGAGGAIKHTYHLVPAIAASIPEPAIQGLLRNPRVTSIEPDITVYAIDDELDNTWGVKHIGAGIVHDGSNKGTGVKIAIIDSGVDYDHPDLNDNYAGGWDFVNNDGDPMDDDGHGTHVAGTIAAEDNNVGVVGVAPEARIYALKVLGADGSGSYSDVIAALEWAVDNGIQVTNNSYGSSSDPGETVKEAFDNAYAAGVLHVAAAGNNGVPPGRGDNVIYPARWGTVIAVSATDGSNIRAKWSSTGPDVELAAPGVNINSTRLGGGYIGMSGTSMASPHVAGTAALVIAAGITGNNAVRQQLIDTADDLGDTGLDPSYGYGLVDADEAALPTEPNTSPVADANGPYIGIEDIAITFEGLGSYDPDGDPLTYTWNFGDGSTGTGVTPIHVYTAGGTYTITLVVNDGKVDSEPTTTTADITEVNDPPVADAGPAQTALVNEVVTFDGSGCYDIDGTIIAYDWDFGDGNTGTGMVTTHAYAAVETYAVVLTVTDNEGLTNTDEVIVTVTEMAANVMHVASIDMSIATRTAGRNIFTSGTATVTVVDANGFPVEGVTVYGQWSGLTSDSDSGITNASGEVTLTSDSVKNSSGTFTFTINDIIKDGWTYEPSANIETSDSITAP